jgi:hypothetical protein
VKAPDAATGFRQGCCSRAGNLLGDNRHVGDAAIVVRDSK